MPESTLSSGRAPAAGASSIQRGDVAARRAGRPRVLPQVVGGRRSWMEPREEILDAAAGLVVDQGFAGTSTREIAEKVGIRQASLYFHFGNKDEILAELLQMSVRPSLDKVATIEAECPAEIPEAALYLLALVDARTLASVPHNTGKLYWMPDVRMNKVYDQFHPALEELTATYGRLGARIVSEHVAATVSLKQLGGMLMQQVESVVTTRAGGDQVGHAEAHAIAATCLRVCGVPQDRIELAVATASDLMPGIEGSGPPPSTLAARSALK